MEHERGERCATKSERDVLHGAGVSALTSGYPVGVLLCAGVVKPLPLVELTQMLRAKTLVERWRVCGGWWLGK